MDVFVCPLQLFFLICVHAHNLCPWLDKDGAVLSSEMRLVESQETLRLRLA